jgi:AcrR family transcriptional regulator
LWYTFGMAVASRSPAVPGLRELKKERTRQAIQKAGLELFAEKGYANTTLGEIAAAAEVSKGTLFAYFPSKETILFPEEHHFYEQLNQRLEQRATNETTFDVLRGLVATLEPPDDAYQVRMKIMEDEGLLDKHLFGHGRVDRLLADAIAKDLATHPEDLRVLLLAAATSVALITAGKRLQPGTAATLDQAATLLEQMFDALRTGTTELGPGT